MRLGQYPSDLPLPCPFRGSAGRARVSKVIISLLDGDNASIRSQVPQSNGASGFANRLSTLLGAKISLGKEANARNCKLTDNHRWGRRS